MTIISRAVFVEGYRESNKNLRPPHSGGMLSTNPKRSWWRQEFKAIAVSVPRITSKEPPTVAAPNGHTCLSRRRLKEREHFDATRQREEVRH